MQIEPDAEKFLRPYIGAEELINGKIRFILALHEASPAELRSLPYVMQRLESVRAYRKASKSIPTRAIANSPATYHVNVVPTAPFLVVPQVSSQRRDYVPIAFLEPPIIPSDKNRVLLGAEIWVFALLTSRMHMAWHRAIGCRLKSDYSYSIGIDYNNFPLPDVTDAQKSSLDALAQKVLDARARFPDSTLADLYDPTAMPPALRKAHQTLDLAVDKLYDQKPFTDDRHRAEHLLGRYEAILSPLLAGAAPLPRKLKKDRV